MATVNYSVPVNIKLEFNKIFSHDNKSHIIAVLMQRAIDEHKMQQQRKKAINKLLALRDELPEHSADELLQLRKEGGK